MQLPARAIWPHFARALHPPRLLHHVLFILYNTAPQRLSQPSKSSVLTHSLA
jgi:hypothetical protein